MTSTAEPGEGRYFRAIEETFVALRGAPLLLAPSDYRVARDWHHRGIPLDVVREALREVFEKRRGRVREVGRISSLRYCAPAVEAAFRRRLEIAGPARRRRPRAAELDLAERLRRLAAALPDDLPDRAVWAGRILALGGDAGAVEEGLAEIDADLLDERVAALGSEELAERRCRAGGELSGLVGRVAHAERDRMIDRWVRADLRRRLRLPVLSLFSPEAEAGASPGETGG